MGKIKSGNSTTFIFYNFHELSLSVVSKENALNYQYINDNKLTKKNQVSEKNTKKLKENNNMEEKSGIKRNNKK